MKSLLLILAAIWSAAAVAQTASEEEMLIMASALTKLAAAAESAERYKDPSPNLTETEFLKFATDHDPALLEPFSRYHVRVLRKDRRAIVMVCNADGTFRLLEDAGCTAELDKHHWRDANSVCDFTIEPREFCP